MIGNVLSRTSHELSNVYKKKLQDLEDVKTGVLQESEKCLMVSEIADRLVESYPKKISTNTIYRHLNLFVDCELNSYYSIAHF